MNSCIHRRNALRLLGALFCLSVTGCGQESFPRHQVGGTVTYQGREVEKGMIIFQPEESVGELAPTCVIPIKDGTFQTPSDESPTTGTYRVRVMGIDVDNMSSKPPEEGEDPDLPPLFPEYVLSVEIPVPDGRLDIEVPDNRKEK